jgi:hypothetical protein
MESELGDPQCHGEVSVETLWAVCSSVQPACVARRTAASWTINYLSMAEGDTREHLAAIAL